MKVATAAQAILFLLVLAKITNGNSEVIEYPDQWENVEQAFQGNACIYFKQEKNPKEEKIQETNDNTMKTRFLQDYLLIINKTMYYFNCNAIEEASGEVNENNEKNNTETVKCDPNQQEQSDKEGTEESSNVPSNDKAENNATNPNQLITDHQQRSTEPPVEDTNCPPCTPHTTVIIVLVGLLFASAIAISSLGTYVYFLVRRQSKEACNLVSPEEHGLRAYRNEEAIYDDYHYPPLVHQTPPPLPTTRVPSLHDSENSLYMDSPSNNNPNPSNYENSDSNRILENEAKKTSTGTKENAYLTHQQPQLEPIGSNQSEVLLDKNPNKGFDNDVAEHSEE